MEQTIKYQRITKRTYEGNIQSLFDELVTGGWEIIYYNEKKEIPNAIESSSSGARADLLGDFLEITIVAGKKQRVTNII